MEPSNLTAANATTDASKSHSRSSCSMLVIVAAVIVLLIAAFMVLRPSAGGTGEHTAQPSAPASSSN